MNYRNCLEFPSSCIRNVQSASVKNTNKMLLEKYQRRGIDTLRLGLISGANFKHFFNSERIF